MMQLVIAKDPNNNNNINNINSINSISTTNNNNIQQNLVVDLQRRKDSSTFFDEFDADDGHRRDFRKTSNDADAFLPTFDNFPPTSEKRATSYTRISFAKPANFNFGQFGENHHELNMAHISLFFQVNESFNK